MKKTKGFTLIELIVSIALIAMMTLIMCTIFLQGNNTILSFNQKGKAIEELKKYGENIDYAIMQSNASSDVVVYEYVFNNSKDAKKQISEIGKTDKIEKQFEIKLENQEPLKVNYKVYEVVDANKNISFHVFDYSSKD